MPNPSGTERLDRIAGIDYRFDDAGLLEQALTHRSFGPHHYERLEFLGDSLLSMVISEQLFNQWPSASEGDLSRLRSRLVRDVTLARVASELHLGDYLRLGPGELKSGGFLRGSILADVFEAIIGAIYLDGGFAPARRVLRELFAERLANLPDADSLKDPKTRLQELLQGRGHDLPEYRVISESGADHAKSFLVECRAGALAEPVRAEAASRRKAEQAAAGEMHDRLKALFDSPGKRIVENSTSN